MPDETRVTKREADDEDYDDTGAKSGGLGIHAEDPMKKEPTPGDEDTGSKSEGLGLE